MDVAYLLELAGIALRWSYLFTAMAWIGACICSVMLDTRLARPEQGDLKQKGVPLRMSPWSWSTYRAPLKSRPTDHLSTAA